MRFVALVSGLILTLYSFTAAQALTLKSIKVEESNTNLHLQFEGSQHLSYRAFSLNNPPRFVIDFPKYHRSDVSVKSLTKGKHMLKNIRSSESPKRLRLVFDLDHSYVFDQKVNQSGRQVVIALHPPKVKSTKVATQHQKKVQIKTDQKKPVLTRVERAREKRIKVNKFPVKAYRSIVVVIDPGHGGKDPGASGGKQYKEKNIVLAIAKQLASELNHQFGFRAILTRSSEKYISLRERLNLARHYNADMFV